MAVAEIDSILSSSATVTPHSESVEDTPLLPAEKTMSWLSLRYRRTRKCVSSKAALLILLWSFVIGLANGMLLNDNPDLYLRITTFVYALGAYGFAAFILCFYPLAGFLADIKWGRHKTVCSSVFVVLVSLTSFLVLGGLYAIYLAFLVVKNEHLTTTVSLILGISGAVVVLVVLVALLFGIVGFNANVAQFGMDQLHDSPGEDRTLFIHWYVWLYYFSSFIGQLSLNLGLQFPYNLTFNSYYNFIGWFLLLLIPLLVIMVLIVTLCLARYKRRWFLIEPGGANPYRLVYKVTRFAYQHKTPVRRSAFTYCEDEVPTGLNLGKEKYGGCFTTEQVEDVKAFYGIFKVLFSFGTVFFLDFAANSVLPLYALHITPFQSYINHPQFNQTLAELILINTGLLSPLLVVVCIPLYLLLLRPFVDHYVPGMLKRMGLGMLLTVLSIICSFSMDTAAHLEDHHHNDTVCMFSASLHQSLSQDSNFLLIQLTLSSLSHMLLYVAVFEFICSQSPHSMKGLLIGLLYAIKGLYQVIATLLVIPFAQISFYPSCGFYYYLSNIVIGLFALLVYVWVARRYRYRERDEPSRVQQYVEEYYSKIDSSYDSSYDSRKEHFSTKKEHFST